MIIEVIYFASSTIFIGRGWFSIELSISVHFVHKFCCFLATIDDFLYLAKVQFKR